ncbi:MAG: helix-turn-helix domain-containing protein, partial [Firmicutes bacterium]|nr:helix-turn-helix domain-containing protein [Bacillota bacterium]
MQRDYRHFFHHPGEAELDHLFYAHSIGIYECDKSFYEDSYYHEGYYFLCVISGRGFIGNGSELFPVGAGNLALLDLSRPYRIYPDSCDPWKFAWIHFDGKTAPWFYGLICDNACLFAAPDCGYFQNAVETLLLCYEKRETGFELRASAMLQQILAELYTVSRDSCSTYIEPIEYPGVVQCVTDYIETNYFRKLTLQELAVVAFISPYHLLRKFKKYTGFTPLEFTNRYRLTLAKQMLVTTELTIEQIALNTGFCSHS